MADTDPVAEALKAEKISDATRAKLWDAFQQAQNPDDLQKLIAPMPAPNSIKATLWDMKQKSMQLTTGDPFLQELEKFGSNYEAPKPSSLTDRAVDALPAAGGLAGGLIGGAGGTAFGVGFGGIPGAVAGATLGGAAGEAAKQTINRLRGQEAPASATDAALGIGKEGAIQGGLELAGAGAAKVLQPVGEALMGYGLRVAPSLAERFPKVDMAATAVKERLPIGGIAGMTTPGSKQALSALKDSANAVKAKLALADRMGIKFDRDQTFGQAFNDLMSDIQKRQIGDAQERQLNSLMAEFARRVPSDITPTAMKELKQTAQQIADPLYRTVARGEIIAPDAAMNAQFHGAQATPAKKALETIPGIAEGEARTQALIGTSKAIRRAELRHVGLLGEAAAGTSGLIAGMLGDNNRSLPEDVKRGVITWLVTRGMMSPRVASRAALTLTSPQLKALFAQFPRLAYEVAHQMTKD